MDTDGIWIGSTKYSWTKIWVASVVLFLATHAFAVLQYSQEYYNLLSNYASSDGEIDDQPVFWRAGISAVQLSFVIILLPRLLQSWFTKDRLWMSVTWGTLLVLLIPNIMNRVPGEDSFVEWLTFGVAFLAGVLFLGYGLKSRKPLYLIFALMWLFFAFEEISWGQRIFGWETPETLSDLNYQEETNFHNLINPVLHYVEPVMYLVFWLLLDPCRNLACSNLPKNMSGDFKFMAQTAKDYGYVDIPLFFVIAFPLFADFTEQGLAFLGCFLVLGVVQKQKETRSV